MRTVPALVAMSSARTGTGQSRCRTLSYTARNRARAASLENPGMRGDLAIPSFSRRRTAPARIEVAHRPVLRPTLMARTRLAVAADGADCPQSRLHGQSRTSVRHRQTGIPYGTPAPGYWDRANGALTMDSPPLWPPRLPAWLPTAGHSMTCARLSVAWAINFRGPVGGAWTTWSATSSPAAPGRLGRSRRGGGGALGALGLKRGKKKG